MRDTLDTTYGALLIGGVLTLQAYIYYESFPRDHLGLRFLVAGVWWAINRALLARSHPIQDPRRRAPGADFSWGDSAALLVSTQALDLHLVFVGMASALCQGFFLSRLRDSLIRTFSQKNWVLTGLLGAACLTTFALEATMSAQISSVPSIAAFNSLTGEVVTTLGLSAAGARSSFTPIFQSNGRLSAVDVAIAACLVFYLQQGKTSFDRTSFVVARVVQYTVATGLATSSMPRRLSRDPKYLYLHRPSRAMAHHLRLIVRKALHFSLGRMYTNALLTTLNSRRNLRKVLDDSGTVGPHTGSSFLNGMPTSNDIPSTREQEMTQLSRKDS
ncbi:hypothetical protein DFH08DRAFT_801512 [Mycena albidolilacea]|uniref:DUF6534 domain-containing protein n=1 Tax=Mycena albidolilacea TaxID=1033008 RepID=A0AAD7F120_9AGAR|nr:hypothetical protein DFH08DRAFT_801512 [Mycena albidolilacea]